MAESTIDITENALGEKHPTAGNIQRFLTFVSDNINFGVSTDYIIEIISNHMICPLPMVPDYIKGIINLRGQTIPIIDIRLRMGKMPQEYIDTTCIIILDVNDISVGIVVDSVTQVQDIDVDKISPIPLENRQELTSSMIAREDGSVILFLDCEELVRQ